MFRLFKKKTTFREFYECSYRCLIGVGCRMLNNQDEAERIVIDIYKRIGFNYELYRYMSLKHQKYIAIVMTKEECSKYANWKSGTADDAFFSNMDVYRSVTKDEVKQALRGAGNESIKESLDNLDFHYRDVLIMKYYYNMSFGKMGRIMYVSSREMKRRFELAKYLIVEDIKNNKR